MKILVSGDQTWRDTGLVKEILEMYSKDTIICLHSTPLAPVIISVANQLGLTTEIVEGLEGIDYLLIFHKYIRGSKRCKALIKEGSDKGIPYQVVGSSF